VRDGEGAPGVTVTVADPRVTPPVIAVITCGPTTVALMVPVVLPAPLVGPGWIRVTPSPVAVRVTGCPASGLLRLSRTVMVTVAVEVPCDATMLGVAETELLSALAGPA